MMKLQFTIQAGAFFLAAILSPNQATAQNSNTATSQNPADTFVGRAQDAPINSRPVEDKFWWSDEWFDNGILEIPQNYQVTQNSVSYTNEADGTDVPAILYRPSKSGKFPAVLFQHGRRGLDDLAQRLAKRMAARGFVVLAPDVFSARFIDRYPIDHDEETESDVNAGVDYLLSLDDVSTTQACLYSHTRGGYYTMKVATKFKRQNKGVACYVAFYPHWQNPNAAEPMQVYRYDKDIDKFEIPVMVFIGEFEQYQRRRSIETAVTFMKKAGKDVKLIIYPGVGRGFDFRTPAVRTFADDLATKDSIQRTAKFIRQHLETSSK